MTSFEYWAQQVPEGQFLCSICYESKPADQAWTDPDGQKWDTCQPCVTHDYHAVGEELAKLRAQLAAVGPVVAAAWALNEATGVQDAIWRYGRKNDEATRLLDALASAVREMGEA